MKNEVFLTYQCIVTIDYRSFFLHSQAEQTQQSFPSVNAFSPAKDLRNNITRHKSDVPA